MEKKSGSSFKSKFQSHMKWLCTQFHLWKLKQSLHNSNSFTIIFVYLLDIIRLAAEPTFEKYPTWLGKTVAFNSNLALQYPTEFLPSN